MWIASVCTAVAIQVRNVAGLYQVYEISGSALQLGITGFLQAFPFVIFGLFAGAVADSFDRKKLLVVTMVVQLIPSLLLGMLTMAGAVQAWHVYSLGFVGALVEVFNWPARSALIPRLVPRSYLMNAMTLNTIIIQMSFLLGPAIGGMLIDHTGLVTTYLLTIGLLLPGGFAILAMRTSGVPQGERRRVNLRSIFEGIEFIWIQRIILSLFLLDFGVTLVGFYRPILPIFAADVFKTGAAGLGVLYGAPSAGAILGSFAVLMVGDIERKGVMVVIAALIFAASLALLGLSQGFSMAVVATLILGFSDSHQRRDSAHRSSAARAGRHARQGFEFDYHLRPSDQWPRRHFGWGRRAMDRCAERAAPWQCPLFSDDPGNLLRDPAALALSLLKRSRGKPFQSFQPFKTFQPL